MSLVFALTACAISSGESAGGSSGEADSGAESPTTDTGAAALTGLEVAWARTCSNGVPQTNTEDYVYITTETTIPLEEGLPLSLCHVVRGVTMEDVRGSAWLANTAGFACDSESLNGRAREREDTAGSYRYGEEAFTGCDWEESAALLREHPEVTVFWVLQEVDLDDDGTVTTRGLGSEGELSFPIDIE